VAVAPQFRATSLRYEAPDRYTDDRMASEMATARAARHMRDLYKEFGDWYLGDAAYNWERRRLVEKAVERTGYRDFCRNCASRGACPRDHELRAHHMALTIMETNAPSTASRDFSTDPPESYDTVETPGAPA